MRLYISVDMEGIAGNYNWNQENTPTERKEVQENIYKQLQWVIEGTQQSERNDEIQEILIADSHSKGNNIPYEISTLDPRIYLISGCPRPEYMMPAMDENLDMVFFVGYHAGVGARAGSMDHTYSGGCIHNIWINGQRVNEAMINGLYAACWKVPVTLVIGDEALKKELIDEGGMDWVEFVTTKRALSRYAAMSYPQEKVKEDTCRAVKKVLARDFKTSPLPEFQDPNVLRIELTNTAMADCVDLMPCIQRIDGRTVELKNRDFKKLFNGIMAVVYLTIHGK